MKCINPVTIVNPYYNRASSFDNKYLQVPCGKCPACRTNYVNGWVYRLKEALTDYKNSNNYFITLTYNEANLPIDFETGEANPRLSDVQGFFKRLRKHYQQRGFKGKDTFRYYLASEFGSHTERPHYHCIIFNVQEDFNDFYDLCNDKWGLGFIYIGNVTLKSIRYVCKYINKDFQDGRNFHTFSKSLGAGYVNRYRHYHLNDVVNNCDYYLGNGLRTALPRYYKDKIYDETQKKRLRIRTQKYLADELARVQRLSPKEYELEQQVKHSAVRSYVDRYEQNIYKSRKKSL